MTKLFNAYNYGLLILFNVLFDIPLAYAFMMLFWHGKHLLFILIILLSIGFNYFLNKIRSKRNLDKSISNKLVILRCMALVFINIISIIGIALLMTVISCSITGIWP
jgi:hypothetical protein